MSVYDTRYLEIAENILKNGFFADNRTGVKTYKLPHQVMQFDLSREFPILTTKFVAFNTAIKELLWIFREQSNDVRVLQKQNVRIWDEWMMEDGTIGTSYGYVVKKYSQIDTLLKNLKTDPQSRRMLIDLWQIPYLDTGALYPCCFLTMWDVTDDSLNCMLVQRSGDFPLGVPFNTSQYAALTHMIAHVSGLSPGIFTHVINNAHIYENQIAGIKTQLERREQAKPAPKLFINPDITNFHDFTSADIKLIDYTHLGKINMPVSV